MKQVKQIISELRAAGTPEKAAGARRFFKTGPGQYAENDRFLGVSVPATRAVAKKYLSTPFPVLQRLLENPWHEVRLCALLVLVLRFKKAKADTPERREIFDFYLKNAEHCNNWDLVDLTAPKIVGAFLADADPSEREILHELAASENLWKQRIAVVSTQAFIRNGDFSTTFELVQKLRTHPHDLIHKALGWMLREIGKYNRHVLTGFLDKFATTLPRTTLRYALEHYFPDERIFYLTME